MLYCMECARGARAPMPQLGGMLLTMEVYEDDCGGGAGGAGGPHVGEILGAGEPRRADATWRAEWGRSRKFRSVQVKWIVPLHSTPFGEV